MKLHSRVYLQSLLVLLVVGAATTLVFALGGRGGFAREMGERMARHTASLAAERLDDRAALTRRLQQLHDELGVDVIVRDPDGRPLAVAGAPLPSPAPEALASARAGHTVTRHGPPPFALAPVRDPATGAIVGTLEIAARHRFGPPGLLAPLLMVGLVLGVVAVVTRPLSRRLSRPVERLTEAARRLGGGDLSVRVPAATSRRWWHRHGAPADEIAQLTRAFNDMAERVQRLVLGEKELLANVSHELRSPLTRLRMALALLPRTSADEARLLEAERDLAELERLIDDVLATARLDATGLPARLGVVDVRALLTALAERARTDPVTAGLDVRVAHGGEPIRLVADEALLRRALWNLVENAAKYGAPPITLSAARSGPSVAVAVDDEGPGIPVEARQRVLDAFQRLDTARTPGGATPGGFGLGLTFARRVAEVHGGRIAIEGERGCRVTLTLPSEETT
jgi:signal transduction histidine kinase